ncbi:hypothetical protein RRG08_009427 [Elysia crispata]|uniref:Uncharacterized protein n=1 Tax=Elysia crispata TaxID=231223 RepID=A0AAE0Y9D8_9GAST|nr:hypothetical protein RRG08_009427 [Elysia crispata]
MVRQKGCELIFKRPSQHITGLFCARTAPRGQKAGIAAEWPPKSQSARELHSVTWDPFRAPSGEIFERGLLGQEESLVSLEPNVQQKVPDSPVGSALALSQMMVRSPNEGD